MQWWRGWFDALSRRLEGAMRPEPKYRCDCGLSFASWVEADAHHRAEHGEAE